MTTIDIQWIGTEKRKWNRTVTRFIRKVFRELELKDCIVSVVFCDDTYMADLNRTYRNKDGATDVLSFSQNEGEPIESPLGERLVGDIVISVDTLFSNAEAFGVEAAEELKRLIVHGILHLTGMDHESNDTQEPMIELQERILGNLVGETLF